MSPKASTFFKWAGALAVGAAGLFAASAASAQVSWSFGVHTPGVSVGVAPAYYPPPPPVYYAPPPPVYYRPPPVYYRPPPVYYGPPPAYYGPPRGYYRDHHHRPHRPHRHWR